MWQITMLRQGLVEAMAADVKNCPSCAAAVHQSDQNLQSLVSSEYVRDSSLRELDLKDFIDIPWRPTRILFRCGTACPKAL